MTAPQRHTRKRCPSCAEVLPPADFCRNRARRDGLASQCKGCQRIAKRIYRQRPAVRAARLRYKREYRAKYGEPVRIKERQYRHAHRLKHIETSRAQERARELIRCTTLEGKARVALRRAVCSRRIKKPEHCERCGKLTPQRRLHGHHADYARPLDVEWLCPMCHSMEHRREVVA